MVGKNVIAMPSDASLPEEWEAYHVAGGRPETAADYNLKAPADFPQELAEKVLPADRLATWQDRLFKAGVSQKAADGIINDFAQDMLADYTNAGISKEQADAELVSGLTAKWGVAFEQNKQYGDIAVTEASSGDFEFQQRLTAKFGNDPDFIEAMANLGMKFSEGKPPGFAAIPTAGDYQDQIDTLMAEPLYMNGTSKQRMAIANKMMVIREKMNPEPK
jgi:hypothetical protein